LQVGGAQGIAVVSAIFGEKDVQTATSTLRALVEDAMPKK
jgi:thiamine monophosphate synthase